MKNFKTILVITTILMISLWNCTEIVEVEVDSSFTRLVVEGYLTTDTMSHGVRLSTTSDYFYNQIAPAVTKASVSIDDGDIEHFLIESDTMPGMYYTSVDFYGIPGKSYTLKILDVDVDGDGVKEEYSASSDLKQVNPVDSIRLKYFDAFGFTGYEVQIFAWDSPEKDWYSFKIHRNGKLVTDTLYELIIQNDDFFNGSYTNGITSQFFSNDKPDEVLEVGDTVTFEINGITEEYYNYVLEAQTSIAPQTPMFSGPPANISSNLNNDALGFFVAYSANYSTTIATVDVINGGIEE